jgi:type II secretory pathway pseudopilin PulG
MYVQKERSMRRREAGFSIIELLIIGAIIAILCAISIYSYMNALNRAKQKKTVNDIRVIAQAWEARASDVSSYQVAGYTFPDDAIDYATLSEALKPTYLRDMPRLDGWLRPLQFAIEPAGPGSPVGGYAIRSAGRNGQFETEYEQGTTNDPDCDIVWATGGFVVFPDVIQEAD